LLDTEDLCNEFKAKAKNNIQMYEESIKDKEKHLAKIT